MGCISLSLAGCIPFESNDESLKISNDNEAEVADAVREQNDSSGEPEGQEQSDSSSEFGVQEQSASSDTVADGFYYGSLYSDGKDRIGVADEWGNLPCIVYDTRIEGDKLIITGSMTYTVTNDSEERETSDDMEHTFVFDDNTDFRWVVGPDDFDHFTAEEFIDAMEDIKDTGLALTVEIENGVATLVSVSP